MCVGEGAILVVHSKKEEWGPWVWFGNSFGNMVLFLKRHAGSRVYYAR